MSKKRKVGVIIICILIFLTVCFIWGNSLLDGDNSSKESEKVYGVARKVLDFLFGENVISHDGFRKLAHGGEFFVLGLELNFLFLTLGKYNLKTIGTIALAGFLVAVADETIQLFTSRGSSLLDVWIDFGGIAATVIIIGATYYIADYVIDKKERKEIE